MNTMTADDFFLLGFREIRVSSSDEFSQYQPEENSTSHKQEHWSYRGTITAGEDTLTIPANIADFESLNLKARIYSLVLPNRMCEEGVAPPTVRCRDKASTLAAHLYVCNRIIPERISPNVENGISIVYRNHLADRTLVIEVYNTTEIAALLNQSKTILAVEDLGNVDDPMLETMVETFKAVKLSLEAQSKRA